MISACGLLVLLLAPARSRAQADTQESTQILLDDLNASRAQQGLRPLALDPVLGAAAQKHAELMAEQRSLEHQLPGELDLAQRVATAGARFSSVGENIAEGGSLHGIHQSWLNSPPHYANMMDREFTHVGIRIARRGLRVYAVQDFSTIVVSRSLEDIEQRVRDLLAVRDIDPTRGSAAARAVCRSGERRYSGEAPSPRLIIQYASPDVDQLGPIFDQKLAPGAYRSAAVGACPDDGARGFTRYKIAVLLY